MILQGVHSVPLAAQLHLNGHGASDFTIAPT
jgi:hypothetical protein